MLCQYQSLVILCLIEWFDMLFKNAAFDLPSESLASLLLLDLDLPGALLLGKQEIALELLLKHHQLLQGCPQVGLQLPLQLLLQLYRLLYERLLLLSLIGDVQRLLARVHLLLLVVMRLLEGQ